VSCGLRDVANLEARGVPTLLVHTHLFRDGAAAQSEMLGQPDMRRIEVPHPVQDKTPDQIRDLAGDVLESVLSTLFSS